MTEKATGLHKSGKNCSPGSSKENCFDTVEIPEINAKDGASEDNLQSRNIESIETRDIGKFLNSIDL